MRFLLYDKDEQYLGRLKRVTKAIQSEEINGEDTLTQTTRDNIVDKNQRIVFKAELGHWKEYVIKGIEKTHSDRGLEYNLHCESSFYETLGDYIDDRRLQDVTATAALLIALDPTRWQVGTVDDLGKKSINFYRISCKECVHKIAEVWGGEIQTRVTVSGNKITGRYVDLLAQRGNDNGVRFTYTKNLRTVNRTALRDEVVTALFGYGKGEYIEEIGGWGRRIDFKELNSGKAYIEDNAARLIWGRNDGAGGKAHVFSKIEFDDCEDPAELLALTTAKLEEISQPQIAYDVNVLDLGLVDLGDPVRVIDREFKPELRMIARAFRIERDLLEKERSIVTFGNYRPSIADYLNEQQAYMSKFRDRAGIWDRANAFGGDGKLDTQFLDGAMDVLKHQLLSTASGWYTDDLGNLVFDALDGSSSMMLSGAGFMIANTKKINGDWDYRTFGTGNGFLADYIIAGTLLGGKVKWNLSDGTLLIGDSVEDYQLFWDGSTLHIKGSISLSDGTDLETALDEIETTPGPKGEDGKDAITVHIDSMSGNIFKNTAIATTLVVTIIKGDKWIDNSTKLEAEFGTEAYLQWSEKKFGQLIYEDIPLNDEKLSDSGFLLTISAADIMTKSTFRCDLMI